MKIFIAAVTVLSACHAVMLLCNEVLQLSKFMHPEPIELRKWKLENCIAFASWHGTHDTQQSPSVAAVHVRGQQQR